MHPRVYWLETGLKSHLPKSRTPNKGARFFQFGTELAYEVKNGKLGQMLRNAAYTGITPRFWGGCDVIGNADHWTIWGTPNCGKGQPGQVAHTGHAAAPARFRNVQVGVLK